MKVTAIDFETANQNPASVCAVGLVSMEDGVITDTFYSLIRPEPNVDTFSYWNIKVHGIYPRDVIDALGFDEVYEQMKPFFEDTLVCAHNARFDMSCLKAACMNCGKKVPFLRYFDTVTLSRHLLPALKHHRLNDVCAYLNVELDHHQACSDAQGCLSIVINAMNMTGIYEIEEMLQWTNVRIYEL